MNPSPNPLRILMTGSNLRVSNGIASFQMNYLRHIAPEDARFDFILLEDIDSPYIEEVRRRGGQVFIMPSPVRHPLAHLRFCREVMKKGQYQILHNNLLLKGLPLMMCAVFQKVPVRILHSHSSRLGTSPLKRKINHLMAPLMRWAATHYLACSGVAGEALFGNRPFTVLPNGISCEKFAFDEESRQSVRRSMNTGSSLVIGSVGRLSVEKNPLFAVDVFQKFLNLHPDALYWWVGNGSMDREVSDYIREKGLEDRILLLGPRSDVPRLYQAMDVFFMPSQFEGLPFTALEAQAAGLPCVISDSVTEEIVYSDLVRFVSLEKSPEQWAEALMEAAVSHNRKEDHMDSDRFDIRHCSHTLLSLYQSCLSGRESLSS